MTRKRPTPAEQLGQHIRQARQAAGLRQIDAAQAAGITQSNWSQYEAGSKDMTISTLRRISHAVKTTPEKLLSGP